MLRPFVKKEINNMQLDLRPEELRRYMGISPCPEDMDAFWDGELAAMKAIDPQIEMRKALDYPDAECFDLYFTGMNGARIYAKYARPKRSEKPAPAVLRFHGYGVKSPEWMELLAWTGQGVCAAALDVRGQGGKSEDVGGVIGNTQKGHIIRGVAENDPHKLLYKDVFLDTAQLAGIVMGLDEVDEERVYAYGDSQGGGLTLACAALEPRIKKAAAWYPFLSDYKRVWELDKMERAYAELKEYFRKFDPLHEREDDFFGLLGYIDIQNLVKRIRAQVLMFSGLMDEVCPPSTHFAAFNRIQSEKKALIYPDFGHEIFPGSRDIVMRWFLGGALPESRY